MYEHDENEVLRDVMAGLNDEVPPMPEGLHQAWMQKVTESKAEGQQTRRHLTRFLSIAAALVFVFGGTLLTRDSLDTAVTGQPDATQTKTIAIYARRGPKTETAVQDDATANGAMFTMARGADTTVHADTPAVPGQKVIRTATLLIETQDYDDSLAGIMDACTQAGGWIEHSSESVNTYSDTRTVWLVLRIPQEHLDDFLAGAGDMGRILSRSESAEDVTASYQDTRARLDTQLALMERLQALITESADLGELLALESQIADTQYQIDTLQATLNATDQQVSYATVTITLQEKQTVSLTDTRVSLSQRLGTALSLGWQSLLDFLGDAVVFLAAASPFLAIAAAAVIIIKLIRRRKK